MSTLLFDFAASGSLRLHNGYHTVTSPERPGRPSDHRTFRLRTAELDDQRAGGKVIKRILGILTGPNNEHDYTDFAFVDEVGRDGEPRDPAAITWKKHRGAGSNGIVDGFTWRRDWSDYEKMTAIFLDLATRGERGYWYSEGFRIESSGRCIRCNRTLTTPESIELGIGPECARKSAE